jgi:hypothetical protein
MWHRHYFKLNTIVSFLHLNKYEETPMRSELPSIFRRPTGGFYAACFS